MRRRLRILLIAMLAWLTIAPAVGHTRPAPAAEGTQIATDSGGDPCVATRPHASRALAVAAARLPVAGPAAVAPRATGVPARPPVPLPRAFASARFHATHAAPRDGDPPLSR